MIVGAVRLVPPEIDAALDPARQKRISGRLAGRGQVFVSVADDAYVPEEAARVWSVTAGALTERGAA